MRITHHREMGITHVELLRLLPRLLAGRDWRQGAGCVQVCDGVRQLVISYRPEQERRIAALRLPVTQIVFEFGGYSDAEAGAFMARFDRTYQRGGG